MAEPIQLFFDQHYPSAVSRALRQRGIDVLTAQGAGRCGLPDPDQLQFATANERVMVTFDSDYLALHTSGATCRHRLVSNAQVFHRPTHPDVGPAARWSRPGRYEESRGIPVRAKGAPGNVSNLAVATHTITATYSEATRKGDVQGRQQFTGRGNAYRCGPGDPDDYRVDDSGYTCDHGHL